jgi:hypothetical protein
MKKYATEKYDRVLYWYRFQCGRSIS